MDNPEYERLKVTFVPLNEEIVEGVAIQFMRDPSVGEILEFIAPLPLKDQIYMVANLLTVSGYTQKEIAEQLDTTYESYRSRLNEIRKRFKEDGLELF